MDAHIILSPRVLDCNDRYRLNRHLADCGCIVALVEIEVRDTITAPSYEVCTCLDRLLLNKVLKILLIRFKLWLDQLPLLHLIREPS